jgi:phospholipid N-methyltransferase
MTPDIVAFLRAWRSDPGRVGAIVPSGGTLARLMTENIAAESAPVVELGAGTGAVTRLLLKRGLKHEDLTLVEFGSDFAAQLKQRFPGTRVVRMDATRLGRARLFEPGSVGAVVSGLPLLNLSRRKIFAVLVAAFDYLRPDGAFYQFTYGPGCPVPRAVLDRLGLQATLVGRTFLNLPPAAVYCIVRKRSTVAAPVDPPVTGRRSPERGTDDETGLTPAPVACARRS